MNFSDREGVRKLSLQNIWEMAGPTRRWRAWSRK